jgi:hypothetical protein
VSDPYITYGESRKKWEDNVKMGLREILSVVLPLMCLRVP